MAARIGGLVAALVVAVCAFLPWATALTFGMSISASGTEEGGDGWLTLVGAIIVGVLFGIWKRGTVIAASVVSLVVLVIAVIDIADVMDTGYGVSVGIGLYLTALGAVAGIVLGIVGQAGLGRRPWPGGPMGGPAQYASAPGAGWSAPGQTWGQAGPMAAAPGWGQPPAVPMPPQPPPMQVPQAAVPPGWYPDPQGQAAARYWDGTRWTEHVQGGR